MFAGASANPSVVYEWPQDARQNWWGHPSGPIHEPPAVCTDCVPPSEGGWNCGICDKNIDGQGDRVSDYVRYCPWLGAGVAEAECQVVRLPFGAAEDTKTGGDVWLHLELFNPVGGQEPENDLFRMTYQVCTARYEDNPGGPHPFQSVGYYDVWVNDTGDFNGNRAPESDEPALEASIEFCPAEPGDTVYYWDGYDWLPCSEQFYEDGCTVVFLHDATEPSSAYLKGGPFAVGRSPAVGGTTSPARTLRIVLPAALLLGLVGLSLGGTLVARRRRA